MKGLWYKPFHLERILDEHFPHLKNELIESLNAFDVDEDTIALIEKWELWKKYRKKINKITEYEEKYKSDISTNIFSSEVYTVEWMLDANYLRTQFWSKKFSEEKSYQSWASFKWLKKLQGWLSEVMRLKNDLLLEIIDKIRAPLSDEIDYYLWIQIDANHLYFTVNLQKVLVIDIWKYATNGSIRSAYAIMLFIFSKEEIKDIFLEEETSDEEILSLLKDVDDHNF